MCVDYTSLNKVCPKDHFPLPHIDQIVDSTSVCEILPFQDAYSGYHQITMKESNQVVTSFIIPYGSYYYLTMCNTLGVTLYNILLKHYMCIIFM